MIYVQPPKLGCLQWSQVVKNCTNRKLTHGFYIPFNAKFCPICHRLAITSKSSYYAPLPNSTPRLGLRDRKWYQSKSWPPYPYSTSIHTIGLSCTVLAQCTSLTDRQTYRRTNTVLVTIGETLPATFRLKMKHAKWTRHWPLLKWVRCSLRTAPSYPLSSDIPTVVDDVGDVSTFTIADRLLSPARGLITRQTIKST